MNYFELFGIPVQLQVDKTPLYRTFIELSKRYHPDYFAQADAAQQEEALQMSALLNKAWKTFQHPEDTIKYVLTEKGLLVEEEKYDLPPDFLMEVLEINEQLMEADEDAGVKENIESALVLLQKDIYEPVEKIITDYQEGVTSQKELLQVKEYYYKKKYLDRIKRQLAGMA